MSKVNSSNLKKLINKGKSYLEISEILNVAKSTVSYQCKKYNLISKNIICIYAIRNRKIY